MFEVIDSLCRINNYGNGENQQGCRGGLRAGVSVAPWSYVIRVRWRPILANFRRGNQWCLGPNGGLALGS